MSITLKDVVDEMDIDHNSGKTFLNPKTEKFVFVPADYLYILDGEDVHLDVDMEDVQDWEREIVMDTLEVRDSGDYLPLPSRDDIDEYGIMEDFCIGLEPTALSEQMLSKIHGPGAFRRFKDAIYQREIENQWFAYRREALEAVAINWLHANEIQFTAGDEAGDPN